MSIRLLSILLPLCGIAFASQAADPPRRVFLAGDSTVAEYGPERAPRNGWGQRLQDFLDPAAFEVRNHAIGGRMDRRAGGRGHVHAVMRRHGHAIVDALAAEDA